MSDVVETEAVPPGLVRARPVVTPARMHYRSEGEYYATPPACTEALLKHIGGLEPKTIWEPACGDGQISRVFEAHGYDVTSTDLVDRGYGTAGVDFLRTTGLRSPHIVTNPPFNLAQEFIEHAIGLGAEFIAMFLRISFLEGRKRAATLFAEHPPAEIHVLSKRPTLWRGGELGRTGGAIAFGWWIWEAPHTRRTVVSWSG